VNPLQGWLHKRSTGLLSHSWQPRYFHLVATQSSAVGAAGGFRYFQFCLRYYNPGEKTRSASKGESKGVEKRIDSARSEVRSYSISRGLSPAGSMNSQPCIDGEPTQELLLQGLYDAL
jgi:hypothetical protein